MASLQRSTGLAYSTVLYAKQGRPVSWPTAKRISSATGGEVSVVVLCEPSCSEAA